MHSDDHMEALSSLQTWALDHDNEESFLEAVRANGIPVVYLAEWYCVVLTPNTEFFRDEPQHGDELPYVLDRDAVFHVTEQHISDMRACFRSLSKSAMRDELDQFNIAGGNLFDYDFERSRKRLLDRHYSDADFLKHDWCIYDAIPALQYYAAERYGKRILSFPDGFYFSADVDGMIDLKRFYRLAKKAPHDEHIE